LVLVPLQPKIDVIRGTQFDEKDRQTTNDWYNQHKVALARGAGDTRLTLGKTHNAATIWLAHASLLPSSN
jgi:hypothetical protein